MDIIINGCPFTVTKMQLASIYSNGIGIIIDGKTYKYYDNPNGSNIFYNFLYESGVFDEEDKEICRILRDSDSDILNDNIHEIVNNCRIVLKSLPSIIKEYELRPLTILKIIGCGKYSCVYLVSEEHKDGSTCNIVLKVTDENESYRTINELEILNYLKGCQFAMQLIRNISYNDFSFVFIEYFESETLREYIYKDHGDYQISAKIIVNLISGILDIHEREILHRDIKPDNILVNQETGDIKYIDFDMSSTFQNFKRSSLSSGTPRYRDPTLVMNMNAILQNYIKADLWTLGISLLEMFLKKKIAFIYKMGKDLNGKPIPEFQDNFLVKKESIITYFNRIASEHPEGLLDEFDIFSLVNFDP